MANYSFLILTSVDMKKFKNAEHVQFHTNVRNIINQADIVYKAADGEQALQPTS